MALFLGKVLAVAFYGSLFSLLIALQTEFIPFYIDSTGGHYQTVK